jgi:hypothetical protein
VRRPLGSGGTHLSSTGRPDDQRTATDRTACTDNRTAHFCSSYERFQASSRCGADHRFASCADYRNGQRQER